MGRLAGCKHLGLELAEVADRAFPAQSQTEALMSGCRDQVFIEQQSEVWLVLFLLAKWLLGCDIIFSIQIQFP
jgi:hypothetical protein